MSKNIPKRNSFFPKISIRGLFHELYRDRRYDTGPNLVWDWIVLKGENKTGDDQQPVDDAQTAPTAKVQDGKTTVQPQVLLNAPE